MKNSKLRRVLMLAVCAVMLVCLSVGATLAYLTSTDEVKNTFTVGKVAITLDEAKVTEYGETVADADRVKANDYKLIPGHSYTKDPIVHVAAGSEKCWLFVKVVNEITAVEATGDTTIAAQMKANGWIALAGVDNVYVRAGEDGKETTVPASTSEQNFTVFEKFVVADNMTNDTLATCAGKTVTITAYAIQADGFETANAAWTALQNATTTVTE